MNQKKDSWNAALYDDSHSFVSKYGAGPLALLDPQDGESILDLGCGTGDIAKQLHEIGAHITAVDNSPSMIEMAKSKYPEIDFAVKDATELDYKEDFDAVFSNATLHWVRPPEKALDGIFRSLKPGGRFVAEFGGKDNVKIITDEIRRQLKRKAAGLKESDFRWYFPGIGEYTSLMEKTGFHVSFAQHIDRPTPLEGKDGLKNWIEMFCGFMFHDVNEAVKASVIDDAVKNLRLALFEDGVWTADYKRIRVIGIKPAN